MSLRLTRRIVPALISLALASTVLLPTSVQPVEARDGSTFVSKVNTYRASHGVGRVSLHSVVDQISVDRANQLASARKLSHDLDYVKSRLAKAGVCWERLGEIIAYNGVSSVDARIQRFVDQWYTSTKGHRELMLNAEYTHAGGSWTTGSNGYHYAVMVFIKLCGAAKTTANPLSDVTDPKFADDIRWVYGQGLMTGCSSTKFCPKARLTRGQLASALAVGLKLPPAPKDYFSDDNRSKHEDAINRVRAAKLMGGCGSGRFCPDQDVRRGPLARVMARALHLPPTARDHFTDDDGSHHEPAINSFASAGIALRCGVKLYCPGNRIMRQHAAVILRRAFD